MTTWLDRYDAERLTGRSSRTLRDWSRLGMVRTGKRGGRVVYERGSLRIAQRVAATRYRDRPVVAGPGRGRVAGDPVNDLTLF